LFFNKNLPFFAKNMLNMKNLARPVLLTLHVLFWVVFIGLCIKAGALLVSFGVSLWVSEQAASNLYMRLNLSQVLQHSKEAYISIGLLVIAITALQAWAAYWVIRVFLKFNLDKPFSPEIAPLISKISHVSLLTGVVAILGKGYAGHLHKQGIAIPVEWAAGETLFFAGIIYMVSIVFEKGIVLQTENELTV
jgi:hypothetical protein